MPRLVRRIGVFLSSPSDLSAEREAIAQVCDEVTLDLGRHSGYVIELIRWETHTWSARGETAQQVIEDQLGTDYDIYVGMLWSRFGTPTGIWQSGTEAEFHQALDLNTKSGRPKLMFFFSRTLVAASQSSKKQLKLVEDFRTGLGSHGVLHFDFLDLISLKVVFRRQLIASIHQIINETPEAPSSDALLPPQNQASDPLSRWRELLASDPEVNFTHLMEQSAESLGEVTRVFTKISEDTKRTTRLVQKANQVMRSALGAGEAATRSRQEAAQSIAKAFGIRARQLLQDIPLLYHNYDVSTSNLQRCTEIAAAHLPGVVPHLSSIIAVLEGSKRASQDMRASVISASATLLSGPLVDVHARGLAALLADLAEFLGHAITLTSSLQVGIATVSQASVE